jgi:hypothetical protein
VATASPPAEVSTAPPDDGGGAGEEEEEEEEEGTAGGRAVVATEVGVEDAGVVTGEAVTAGCERDGTPGAVAEGEPGRAPGTGPCAASLASALFTVSWVSSWAELPVMPWPSSETARRLPVVAVAAPRSQAATPKRMRLRTPQRRTSDAKAGLRPC